MVSLQIPIQINTRLLCRWGGWNSKLDKFSLEGKLSSEITKGNFNVRRCVAHTVLSFKLTRIQIQGFTDKPECSEALVETYTVY